MSNIHNINPEEQPGSLKAKFDAAMNGAEPQAFRWDNIEEELHGGTKKPFAFWWRIAAVIGIVAGLAGLGTLYFKNTGNKPESIAINQTVAQQEITDASQASTPAEKEEKLNTNDIKSDRLAQSNEKGSKSVNAITEITSADPITRPNVDGNAKKPKQPAVENQNDFKAKPKSDKSGSGSGEQPIQKRRKSNKKRTAEKPILFPGIISKQTVTPNLIASSEKQHKVAKPAKRGTKLGKAGISDMPPLNSEPASAQSLVTAKNTEPFIAQTFQPTELLTPELRTDVNSAIHFKNRMAMLDLQLPTILVLPVKPKLWSAYAELTATGEAITINNRAEQFLSQIQQPERSSASSYSYGLGMQRTLLNTRWLSFGVNLGFRQTSHNVNYTYRTLNQNPEIVNLDSLSVAFKPIFNTTTINQESKVSWAVAGVSTTVNLAYGIGINAQYISQFKLHQSGNVSAHSQTQANTNVLRAGLSIKRGSTELTLSPELWLNPKTTENGLKQSQRNGFNVRLSKYF